VRAEAFRELPGRPGEHYCARWATSQAVSPGLNIAKDDAAASSSVTVRPRASAGLYQLRQAPRPDQARWGR
jgi:hypothetical protein